MQKQVLNLKSYKLDLKFRQMLGRNSKRLLIKRRVLKVEKRNEFGFG